MSRPAAAVRDWAGDEYPLKAAIVNGYERNGNQTISLTALPNKVNASFIDSISEMWMVIDHDDVEHKIIYFQRKGVGKGQSVQIKGVPLFFDVLDSDRIYERYDEHMTAEVAFSRIFEGTGFSYVLADSFNAVQWEGFGDGESKLESFKRSIDRYGAEFKIIGKTVYLHKMIGRDLQVQYRHRLNASNITLEHDASALWTHAKGYGDYGDGEGSEDWQDAKLVREYTSPLAAIPSIGKRHAPPIKNGNITTAAKMDEELKRLVDESLKISVAATLHDLRDNGYPIAQPEVGDRVFLVDDRIGLNEEVRMEDLQVTRNWRGEVKDLQGTFGTQSLSKRYQSRIDSAVGAITDILEGRKELPLSALNKRVQEITDIINGNTDSVFEYMANGVRGWNGDDPNYMTRYVGDAIGFSSDGGATYGTAMSAKLGIVANYIMTGILDAARVKIQSDKDHMYWDATGINAINKSNSSKKVKLDSNGLNVEQGMIQVKGPAGTVIIDGTSNMHKILATGLVTMTLPAGTVKKSVSFTHNLGYKPAYSAYMQGDTYNEIDELLSHQLPYFVTDSSTGSISIKSIVSAECDTKRITFDVHRATDYGQAMPEKTLTFRYFVYKEVAF